jgi:succinate-semialdehyde dehydrogenase/glutarate-semialdehyde dehydrogenase
VLEGAARLMLERREELARIATLEQGKTLAEARIEVMMNVGLFRFYAGEVQRLYGRRWCARQASAPAWCTNPWARGRLCAVELSAGQSGAQAGRAHRGGLLGDPEGGGETPASALGVLQCLLDAGLPGDVAQAVFGVPSHVSAPAALAVIRKLSFTGSTAVGKALIKLAAEDLKRTTMELGGHGPVLVFADADLDRARTPW